MFTPTIGDRYDKIVVGLDDDGYGHGSDSIRLVIEKIERKQLVVAIAQSKTSTTIWCCDCLDCQETVAGFLMYYGVPFSYKVVMFTQRHADYLEEHRRL